MCRMPNGVSDFKKLRKKGFTYIDKTNYIELLENGSANYIHFLRPRRFGKTLFTSMLGSYYDVNTKDEFEELFKGTYIYDHPTKEHNTYHIFQLDFSGLNSSGMETIIQEFHNRIYQTCKVFLAKYQINEPLEKGTSAADCMFSFLSVVKSHSTIPLYVIIDEYDHFANELLSFRFDDFHNIVSKNGYVRKFYEVLKTGTVDSTIGRIFVTGVSPITMDSMTSGYNISTNLTLDPRFNEMMGFTSEEIKYLISQIDNIKNESEVLASMKRIYDGYMFSKKGSHHLYNPNMSLYYLDYIQTYQAPPEDIIDPNIYSDYKKLENLLNIKPNKEHQDALNEILEGKEITIRLTISFSIEQQFTRTDFLSLLYYLGYLTISDVIGGRIKVKVPNDVIRLVYFDYFRAMLQKKYHVNTETYEDAIDNILYEKDNTLFVLKMEEILSTMDERDRMEFQEKHLKVAGLAVANASASVLVKSEYAVSDGYCDIVLFPYLVQGATSIIELKYIKKADLNEKTLQEKRQEAIQQIQKYMKTKEFQNVDVVKWILIFSKDKCVCNETVDE